MLSNTAIAAVTGYEVRRDGVLITTTAQTNYNDSGLNANTSYTYTVSARDAAGNTSAQSTSATITTLAAADITPPSAPQNIAVE